MKSIQDRDAVDVSIPLVRAILDRQSCPDADSDADVDVLVVYLDVGVPQVELLDADDLLASGRVAFREVAEFDTLVVTSVTSTCVGLNEYIHQHRVWLDLLTEEHGLGREEAERQLRLKGTAAVLDVDWIATTDRGLLASSARAGTPYQVVADIGLRMRRDGHLSVPSPPGVIDSLATPFAYIVAIQDRLPHLLAVVDGCPSTMPDLKHPNERLNRLGGSLTRRLMDALYARDRVLEVGAFVTSLAHRFELGFYTHSFIVCIVGVLDALARLVHLAYGVPGEVQGAGWWRASWLQALRGVHSSLADAAETPSRHSLFSLLRELRNTVHAEAFDQINVSREGSEEILIQVPLDASAGVRDAVGRLGGNESWGLTETLPDLWCLKPAVLVERLLPEALAALDALLGAVDLGRLPDPTRAREGGPGFASHMGAEVTRHVLRLMAIPEPTIG